MPEIDLHLTDNEPGALRVAPTIRVEIYNQTYNIRSDRDSEYLQELAALVDGRMREISSGTLTADSLNVAILAALYIADELVRLKQAEEVSDKRRGDRRTKMLQARGLWKNRSDLPDFEAIRREWDRA